MRYKFENVKVVKVIDGDTVDVLIDFGFKLTQVVRLRLFGINTPEIRGKERPEGLKVKQYLKDKIEGKDIVVETFKKGKYGRYVANIYLGKTLINEDLVKKGFAKYAQY